MNVNNDSPGTALTDQSRVMLVASAQNPKVYTTGDENSPIIMAYDAVESAEHKLHLVKYDNLNFMMAG